MMLICVNESVIQIIFPSKIKIARHIWLVISYEVMKKLIV